MTCLGRSSSDVAAVEEPVYDEVRLRTGDIEGGDEEEDEDAESHVGDSTAVELFF